MLSPAGAVAPRHINTLYPGKKSPGKKQEDAEPPSGFSLLSPSHRAFNPFSIKSDKEQKIKAQQRLVLRGPEMMGQKGGGVREINSLLTRAGLCSVSLRGIREKRVKGRAGEKSFLKLTGENAGTQQEEEVSLRHEKSHRGAEL